MNRGVELSADAIDSPQALIAAAGRGRRGRAHGGALRAARRRRHGARARAAPDGGRRRHERPAAVPRARRAGGPADPRRARARPARGLDARARRARARRRDRRARRAGLARRARRRRGRRRRTGCTCSRPSSTRTSTCARPGQEHKEDARDRHAPRPRPAATARIVAMPNTDADGRRRAACCARCATAAAREARVPVGFLPAITRGLRGEELTEMAELRDAGALGFTDDGKPVVARRDAAPRAAVPAAVRRRARAARGGPVAVAAHGVMHEGAVSARARAWPGSRRSRSRRWSRATPRSPRYEERRASTSSTSPASSRSRRSRPARRPARRSAARPSPHHLTLTDEAVLSLDSRFKMNPPLRTEADRQALIAGLRDGTIDCVATDHAPHARTRRRSRSRRRRWASPDSRPPSPRSTPTSCCPGVLPLALVVERMTAGARAARPADPADRRRRAREPRAWSTSTRAGRSASAATRASRRNSCFDGRTLRGVVRLTVAAGAVVHRAEAPAEALA